MHSYTLPMSRGVPTEQRKPCDCTYWCIERVCRSVGTLILCDFCYFRSKITTKITWDGFRPSSNMLNISFRWAHFPIKNSRKAQWVHLFLMNINGFRSVCLYFSLKVHFRWKNDLSMGTPYTFDEGMSCHSTRIELFYFDDNFHRIAQWVPPLMLIRAGPIPADRLHCSL